MDLLERLTSIRCGVMLNRMRAVTTRHPFKTGVAVTTCKTVAADLLVQLAIERREWDARRTALFAAFGCIYQVS